jgi:hypothetical protein
MLVRDKHSSLLDPFVGYAKNEALRIRTLEPTLWGSKVFKSGRFQPYSLAGKACKRQNTLSYFYTSSLTK